jgi:hypothetical protein
MRVTTRRGDTKFLECQHCGKRASKEKSRDAIWLEPNPGFVASLDDQRHAGIAATLTPFPPERGRRLQR